MVKLDSGNRKKDGKFKSTWKLNNTPEQPMDQRIKQKRNKKYLNTNEKGNSTSPKL